MPKINLKVATNLTKEQWKELLARVVGRSRAGAPQLTPQTAGQILGHEPPSEKVMGRLVTKGVDTAEQFVPPKAQMLPLEDAQAAYLENPSAFKSPFESPPPANWLRQVEPGSPEELAQGLAYDRLKVAPLFDSSIQRTTQVMGKQGMMEAEGQALGGMGVEAMDVRPGVPINKFLQQKGVKLDKPPIEDIIREAVFADVLWKDMGGGRSVAGKTWTKLLEQSRQKTHHDSGRDYFIVSFRNWRKDPERFAQKHPREANLLERTWRTFLETE